MGWILLLLVLALIFGGLGFVLHALWWIAIICLVIWAVCAITGTGRKS
jgi:lysylphosphatidylglycerol synthetase-like protein (DUF2156 family)